MPLFSILSSFRCSNIVSWFCFRTISCNTCKRYARISKRTSSISSRGPLTENDATFVVESQEPPPQERELFSIGDQDGGEDGRPSSLRRRGTEDEFFYDEIFERSEFTDESTSRANKQLISEQEERDILEELGIPDLEFKKPSA